MQLLLCALLFVSATFGNPYVLYMSPVPTETRPCHARAAEGHMSLGTCDSR